MKSNKLSSYLKDANYLMVDNLDGLEFCIQNGLSKNTQVISFNPYLVLDKNHKIKSPESELSKNYHSKFSEISKIFSGKIFNKVYEYSKENSLAVYSAQYIISAQNMVHKMGLILNLIRNSNLVIVYPDFIEEKTNKNINGNLYNLLECYNNIRLYKFKYKNKDQYQLGRDPISNFWLRLNFEGLNSILYRFFVIFSNKLGFLWKGKKILISHENTLLKGTASYLFRRGFFIQKMSNIIDFDNLNTTKSVEKLVNIVSPLIHQYQEKFTLKNLNQKNKLLLKKLFKEYLLEYLNSKEYWKKYFNHENYKNICAFLVGTPVGPRDLSCIEVARKKGIITASFQHGISKEINTDILSIDILYEANLVDYYFTYNKKASAISLKSRFHIASENTVGLPEDMTKGIRKQKRIKKNYPILYASTNLYSGNKGITVLVGPSDINKANTEIDLIECVLSKIPHNINYKPYYSRRYVGLVPEIEIARTKDNIFINEEEVDLRYIVSSYRIVITSRATSTLGWCVMSGKPIIYIENLDTRLTKQARKDFKTFLFYFDVLEKNWDKNLYNFLSQPIEIIEKEWKKKILLKNEVVNKYFGYENTNAEKKCANILSKII